MKYDILPKINGYHWRSINQDDLDTLILFDQVCSSVDGFTHTSRLQNWQYRLSDQMHSEFNSIIAIKENEVIAAGWIDYSPELNHVRAFLDGSVHPDYRSQGIGRALLTWLEVMAIEHLREISNGRDMLLRIMFYNRPPDAIKLFEASGFSFTYAEVEMAFNLERPLPDYSASSGTTIDIWNLEISREYYSIYKDAFKTRTYNLMEESDWFYHFANIEDKNFCPDLSLLLRTGNQAVAYTVCHVKSSATGELREEPWITQMGVRQAYRRQGFASQLLGVNLHHMRSAGYSKAMLSVNVNNPEASKLYKQVGFETVKTFTMYAKEINA